MKKIILAFSIVAMTFGLVKADPPFCEIYKVTVTVKDGGKVTGFVQTTTQEYGWHAPGSLTEAEFKKNGDIEPKDTLRIYRDVYQFVIPGNVKFVALPENTRKTIKRDLIASINVDDTKACSGVKEYDYLESTANEIPDESYDLLKNKRFTFSKVYSESDEYACWMAADKKISKQKRIKIFRDFQKEKGKNIGPQERNKEYWTKKKVLLFCTSLVW